MLQAQQAQAQAQMMQNLATQQRRDDDESGALKFHFNPSPNTILNFGPFVGSESDNAEYVLMLAVHRTIR